jgi:Luciferase
MPVTGAKEKIKNSVLEWEGIILQPHRFGGIEFKFGKREIGHIHGDYLVDIPFPVRIKNKIISSGLADVHHILPKSGWISKYLETNEDVDIAIELLRESFELAVIQKSKRIVKN